MQHTINPIHPLGITTMGQPYPTDIQPPTYNFQREYDPLQPAGLPLADRPMPSMARHMYDTPINQGGTVQPVANHGFMAGSLQFQDPMVSYQPMMRTMDQLHMERANVGAPQDTFDKFIGMCRLHVGFWHLQRGIESVPMPCNEAAWNAYRDTFITRLDALQKDENIRRTGYEIEFVNCLARTDSKSPHGSPRKMVKFMYYIDIDNKVTWMFSLINDIREYGIKPSEEFIEYVEFMTNAPQ